MLRAAEGGAPGVLAADAGARRIKGLLTGDSCTLSESEESQACLFRVPAPSRFVLAPPRLMARAWEAMSSSQTQFSGARHGLGHLCLLALSKCISQHAMEERLGPVPVLARAQKRLCTSS